MSLHDDLRRSIELIRRAKAGELIRCQCGLSFIGPRAATRFFSHVHTEGHSHEPM